jgi:hypothetical protein
MFEVSVSGDGNTFRLEVTNRADGTPVILKFVWHNRGIEYARMDYQVGNAMLNGHASPYGAPRLTKGDRYTIWGAVAEIAKQAEPCVPKNLALDQLDELFRGSSFACVTTIGETFESPISAALLKLLVDRIRLIRTEI